ncbi:hypothetical protein HK097_008467 [Rhizophlyctis rosea]|uniref:Uncharacterized protein n=1 Tax=Rhizophlyctis rosea TaxID=64517 RepID=A0AAD5SNA9_9FUNG|nr:hypothetical protein HK097_008467 [Rhizophlyctis rosea]
MSAAADPPPAPEPSEQPINNDAKDIKESTDALISNPSESTDTFTKSKKPKPLPKNWGPEHPFPDAKANILSRLTFTWLDPVFRVGNRQPLNASDLYHVSDQFRVKTLHDAFNTKWEEEVKLWKDGKKEKPSLGRAMMRAWAWRVLPVGIVKLLSDMASILSPFLVKYILEFVQKSRAIAEANAGNPAGQVELPPLSQGFGYAIGLFLINVAGTLFLANYFQVTSTEGMAMRGALTAAIYRKSLTLSALSRQDFNSGKVMTMVATDAQRIELFMTFGHIIWSAPFQIVVITIFLILQLGWPALVGIAILVVSTPLQIVLMRFLSKIRRSVAPLTDSRVKLTQEVLQGIRVIKFFAWEASFSEKIEEIRKKEMRQVFKRAFLGAFVTAIAFALPIFAAALAIVIYGVQNPLDPTKIFPALTWFNLLRLPLMFLPQLIVNLADMRVAVHRIGSMLTSDELQPQPEVDRNLDYAVKIENGEFAWESKPPEAEKKKEGKKVGKKKSGEKVEEVNVDASSSSSSGSDTEGPKTTSTLRNINLHIPRGTLTAVVGTVGSGKSSLLSALVGEMKRTSGHISFGGSMGYAPQQAWIQNASLRENVVFGRPWDEEKYWSAVSACALEKDLEVLESGDSTMIGERGINLSGGQKQRVNIARVTYSDPDIVLLDDPLSAVDAHVGRWLFEKCILGALQGKTRILVTHQLHFLPRVDYVLVMKDGMVAEEGTYNELMARDGEFAALMKGYGGVDSEGETSAEEEGEGVLEGKEEVKGVEVAGVEPVAAAEATKAATTTARTPATPGKALMQTEERATGSVKAGVWLAYARAGGGKYFVGGLLSIALLLQLVRVANDYWLVEWTNGRIPGFTQGAYVGIYWGLGVGQAIATYLFGLFFAFTSVRSARTLHHDAARRVLSAPVRFFDTTPLGRIINRFSKDMDGLDNTISESFRMFTITLATSISTFVLIIYATPWFAIVLVPVLIIYYFVQKVYRNVSRELKRIDSLTRSPLYAHVGETLTGLSTIRAYRDQSRFVSVNDTMIDANNSPYYLMLSAQRWLAVRLETLGTVLVFCAAAFGVISRTNENISTALLGLSLSYALQVTGTLNWCVRQFTETEVAMNAVERVEDYAYHLEQEAEYGPGAKVGKTKEEIKSLGWPRTGGIVAKDVVMRYAKDLPPVLKGVSFEIGDGEKVGVVGRTGSGKSSLMIALFRMVELSGGRVEVDGVDAASIPLNELRAGLSIIPQDPVVFSGTVRSNLDPFNTYSDSDIWDALERAGMKERVVKEGKGLEMNVTEGGENLSVGQRQLLCLARAMLKKPKVLVLDEATANIDYETDAVIQKVLRRDFEGVTVVTIAHRLNTIIDYDRVMVLTAGEIVEYDSPKRLLDLEDGKFRAMVEETGPVNAELLRNLAK